MQKRMNWIDIAKGIAILSVVVGHVMLIPWEPYRKIIYSFHMPLFFVVAGYTAKEEFNWTTLKKMIERLVVPYIVATVLTGIVRMLYGSNLKTEVLRIFWGSGVPANYGPGVPITGDETIQPVGAIWFLICMFFSKLFFSLFLSATKAWKEWMRALVVLAICSCGYIIGQHYKLPLYMDAVLFNIIFFYSGYLFKKYNGIARKSITLGVVLLAFWNLALKNNALELSARIYHEFPTCIFTTLGSIAGCCLIFYISNEVIDRIKGIRNLLIYCGRYSMDILLIHYLDGDLWHSAWFISLLPDFSGLSPLKQGCIIAVCKLLSYLIICVIYTTCKKYISRWIKNHKKSMCMQNRGV